MSPRSARFFLVLAGLIALPAPAAEYPARPITLIVPFAAGGPTDVPTTTEVGLPEFQVAVWRGVYASKATPKPVIDRLLSALQHALKDSNVTVRFAELGTEPLAVERGRPEALRAHPKADIEKWGPIIKKAGVYAD